MSTPICDFVENYRRSNTVRFHMPGHKGIERHGLEPLDITEIKGADYLFGADGIIAQSEMQMSEAYGTAATLYSTEGSSLCIKTMLGIIDRTRSAEHKSERMLVAAPRNVHKAFINACILLDIDVFWIYPKNAERFSLCSGGVTPEDISDAVDKCPRLPDCVYVTSPDYTGFCSDIKGISEICRPKNIPLIVDNAHGAYFKFLEEDIHPITLGADMCCDSAHKTLPCYTGAAMLHISKNAPESFCKCAKNTMSLFASTSPSYLIMQSLDMCADRLMKNFRDELARCTAETQLCKEHLIAEGWKLSGSEKCKITISAAESGIYGCELGDELRKRHIEPEYTDAAYTVLMVSVCTDKNDFLRLEEAMRDIPRGEPLTDGFESIPNAVQRMPIRQAAFSRSVTLPVDEAVGRICAMTLTSCQPSVPAAVSGEEITPVLAAFLRRCGINEIDVVL